MNEQCPSCREATWEIVEDEWRCSVCNYSSPLSRKRKGRTIRHQVTEFHRVFDQPILDTPQIPPEDRIRLRLRLISEEFFELLQATIDTSKVDPEHSASAMRNAMMVINTAPIKVDLVELADALGDLDYVIEGTRLEFGIDGAPIASVIHESNMAKAPDGVVRKTEAGKVIKPEGWKAPDIESELRKQGWKGHEAPHR